MRLLPCLLILTLTAATPASAADDGTLRLNLRTRVQPFKGSDAWDEVALVKELPARETALLICDMWDKHWCQSASKRCDALAHKMVPVVNAARAKGVLIIHAPSDTMAFYKDTPQRKRMLETPRATPPKPFDLPDPPIPVDSSDGGCDDEPPAKNVNQRVWTRQHPAIPVANDDVISDNGAEVYSYLRQHGVKNLVLMGVHTNMCVLGRTFSIKQMTRWGIRCVLVRDLTDAMYNPKLPPHVSHDEGTQRVIQHIEKYWCPTILSSDLEEGPAASR